MLQQTVMWDGDEIGIDDLEYEPGPGLPQDQIGLIMHDLTDEEYLQLRDELVHEIEQHVRFCEQLTDEDEEAYVAFILCFSVH